MADRLVFTALNRKKRGANKSPFLPNTPLKSRNSDAFTAFHEALENDAYLHNNALKHVKASEAPDVQIALKHVWCRRNAATPTANKRRCLKNTNALTAPVTSSSHVLTDTGAEREAYTGCLLVTFAVRDESLRIFIETTQANLNRLLASGRIYGRRGVRTYIFLLNDIPLRSFLAHYAIPQNVWL